jgi:F-type H+-transporting ATPase subunit a
MSSLNFHPSVLAADSPLTKVLDHVQVGSGFAIVTNHMILMAVTGLIMLFIFPIIAAAYRKNMVPSGLAGFVETILTYLRDQVCRPLLGDATDKFMPYLWTMFFFILINNLLGLLPLYELTYFLTKPFGLYPVYGTATGNVGVTAALAITAFFVIQGYALKKNGIGAYLSHLTGGTPPILWPIMVPIELLGLFIKPFALTMRLFANMFAGGLVLKLIMGFVPLALAGMGLAGAIGVAIPVILASVALTMLKLLVALLQAFIFVFLTTIFIAQMAESHDHEHDHAHGHGDEYGHAKAEHARAGH